MIAAFIETSLVASIVLIVIAFGARWPAPLRHGLLLVALLKFAVPHGLFVAPFVGQSRGNLGLPIFLPEAVTDAIWLVYCGGAVTVFAILCIRLLRLHLLARRCRVVESPKMLALFRSTAAAIGARRIPRLLVSEDALPPVSFGVIRPAVLVSQQLLDTLNHEQLRVVFAHELIHHRRGDLVLGHLQAWLSVAWWFHPLFHVTARRLEQVREESCDDFLLARQVATDETYCAVLMQAANSVTVPRFALPATAMARHPLNRRMRRIMAPLVRRERISVRSLLLLIALGAVVLPNFIPLRMFPPIFGSSSPSPSPSPSDSSSPSPSP